MNAKIIHCLSEKVREIFFSSLSKLVSDLKKSAQGELNKIEFDLNQLENWIEQECQGPWFKSHHDSLKMVL